MTHVPPVEPPVLPVEPPEPSVEPPAPPVELPEPPVEPPVVPLEFLEPFELFDPVVPFLDPVLDEPPFLLELVVAACELCLTTLGVARCTARAPAAPVH